MCRGEEGAAGRTLRAQAAAAAPVGEPASGTVFRTWASVLDALAARSREEFGRSIELLTPVAGAPQRPPVGPPPLLRPQELLADALLRNGQTREAAALYERALLLTPNRALTLLGLAQARAAAGDGAGAAAAYGRLLASWHRADPDLDLLAEARSGAGGR
jgi:tetratricopeptide (TPR) repeat protein